MKDLRVYSVQVQIVATELDEQGRPIDEVAFQPTRVFRAKAEDFWAHVDALVEKAQRAQEAPK